MEPKTLKIGVLSDTHFRTLAQGAKLIGELLDVHFADADVILHAGDMIHPDIGLLFADVPFYAVRGNNDPAVHGVPEYRIIELGGYRIGLIHGWGNYADLEQRMIAYCAGDNLDCLVYGHSHYAVCHKVGNILVINPGSTTDRRRSPCHSVAMLYLGDSLRGEIINIDAVSQIV